MFELMDTYTQSAVIKVVGVGGGGGNAVDHMVGANIEGVDFICANTDAQALKNSSARILLQLGSNITKGLGAGANPDIGRQAALEDRDRIADILEGADMVFITAGMGGGTGTGGAPVVSQVAKDLGILTVAVVTKPFPFEGGKRLALLGETDINRASILWVKAALHEIKIHQPVNQVGHLGPWYEQRIGNFADMASTRLMKNAQDFQVGKR